MLEIMDAQELMDRESEEAEQYVPVQSFKTVSKDGRLKTIRTNSYVALLCRRNGSSVMAVRYDGYTSKYDLPKVIKGEWPGWKLKGVYKLYEEDFLEKEAD